MESPSQQIFLVRHGETEWSRSGQHTGRTNIPLTQSGEQAARLLEQSLRGRSFAAAFTSPLDRARHTSRLAGFPDATVDNDLSEWDYGVYEGRTTLDIRKAAPDWSVWLSPIENGESLDQVAARARRVIERVTAVDGDVAVFAHGHILRILAACWTKLPPLAGRYLFLDTSSISVLGYERQTRVIRHWNVVPGVLRSGDTVTA
jgi:probable phosphoglycerate mutase